MLLVISYCVTNLIIFMHIKFKLLEYSRNLHEVFLLFRNCICIRSIWFAVSVTWCVFHASTLLMALKTNRISQYHTVKPLQSGFYCSELAVVIYQNCETCANHLHVAHHCQHIRSRFLHSGCPSFLPPNHSVIALKATDLHVLYEYSPLYQPYLYTDNCD